MSPIECVAQLVEHLTFNQVAEGSNPSALTIYKSLKNKDFFCFWYASSVAPHLSESSLISCTYKIGTCIKSIAKAPVMQSVMQL